MEASRAISSMSSGTVQAEGWNRAYAVQEPAFACPSHARRPDSIGSTDTSGICSFVANASAKLLLPLPGKARDDDYLLFHGLAYKDWAVRDPGGSCRCELGVEI